MFSSLPQMNTFCLFLFEACPIAAHQSSPFISLEGSFWPLNLWHLSPWRTSSSTVKWKGMASPCLSPEHTQFPQDQATRVAGVQRLFVSLASLKVPEKLRIIWGFFITGKEDHTHGPLCIAPWNSLKNMEVALSPVMRRPGLIKCRPQMDW
jgi:hypothetical protein